MDPKAFLQPLRSLQVLNLVVSTEPLDVADALTAIMGRFANDGTVRAVTRRGIIDIREYIGGRTLRYDQQRGEPLSAEQMLTTIHTNVIEHSTMLDIAKHRTARAAAGESLPNDANFGPEAQKVLDTALGQDPKNEQFVYLAPDLWPYLVKPDVMAAVQRIREQRSVDPRCVKMLLIVVPSLDCVTEVFRPTFTIIKDEGLTTAQAKAHLDHVFEQLSSGRRDEAGTVGDAMAALCTGLSSSEIDSAVANAVIEAHPKNGGLGFPITSERLSKWCKRRNV